MSSPVIDETMMIHLLTLGHSHDTANAIGTGAFLLIMDAWDRNATRDQFMAAVGAAIMTGDRVGRASIAKAVRHFLQANGQISLVDVETMVTGTETLLKEAVAECTKMGNLLKQCALDEDKIH